MNWFMRMALPYFMPMLINALADMVRRSDNTIDDVALAMFIENQDAILEAMKRG